MGHTVFILHEETELIGLLKNNHIEIAIVDIDNENGLDSCNMIKSYSYTINNTYVYILIVTKLNRSETVKYALHLGADDFLSSPPDMEEVYIRTTTGQRIVELSKNNMHLFSTITNSRNKFKLMVDTLEESIISVDKNLNILSANKAFLKFVEKHDFKNVINKPYKEMMYCINEQIQHKSRSLPAIHVFDSGTSLFTQIKIKKQNKNIYLKIHSEPIKNQDGEIIQVIETMSDITKEITAINQSNKKNKALSKALNAIEKTQAQLIQSEKMASVGQLAAGVAHEINNPVGFIISNLKTLGKYQRDIIKLLEKYQGIGSGLQDYFSKKINIQSLSNPLEQIQSLEKNMEIDYIKNDIIDLINECDEGAERIKNIVSDLKNFAHPGEEKLKYTNINKNLDSTLNVVRNELKYKATIIKNYGELPDIPCYPQQLSQVFINLLVNAAHAIAEQGEIKIITRLIDEYIEIIISDTGKGISKKDLTKIFDPFFTTKDVGKGTGLGLHVVYNIIQKHHGSIEVKSKVNMGTTFIIKVPVNLKNNKEVECH